MADPTVIPFTFAPGAIPTASQWNQYQIDVARMLNPEHLQASSTSPATVASGLWVTAGLVKLTDTLSGFNAGTSVYTIQDGGTYAGDYEVQFDHTSLTGQRRARLVYTNGATVYISENHNNPANVAVSGSVEDCVNGGFSALSLAAGGTLALQVWQDSGSSLTMHLASMNLKWCSK
jgi:hypothetical protein